MLDSKLSKIKNLILEKERIEAELAVLLGEQEKPKRGRPSTKTNGADTEAAVQSE